MTIITKLIQVLLISLVLAIPFQVIHATTITSSGTNETCKTSDDGKITITIASGAGNYTYGIWSNDPIWGGGVLLYNYGPTADNSHTFINIPSGTYYVGAIGSDALAGYAWVTVTEPSFSLTGSIDGQTNVLCNGALTGAVTVSGHDGWGSYTYNIDGGAFQSAGTFNSLAGGNHTVIVKDAGGCQAIIPVTINYPTAIDGNISSLNNVTCNGLSNGSFIITASGGVGPYSIRLGVGAWVAGASRSFSGLAAATYNITIRDANACTIPVAVAISQPDVLTGDITVNKNITCYDSNDGELIANPMGGTAPYSYKWTSTNLTVEGQTGQIATGIMRDDIVTVEINDANSCGTSNPVEPSFIYMEGIPGVVIPAQIVINPNPPTHVDECQGQANGSITIAGAGGTGTLTYSIISGGSGTYLSSNLFNSLVTGIYEIWIKDASGCKAQGTSVNVGVRALPIIAIAIAETSGTTNNDGTICNGASVTLTASGGTSYLWSTGATTAAINVSPTTNTTYTVTVTNANGCTDSKSQAIVVVAIPTAAIAIAETSGTTNNDGTICNGASVTLTASGGSSYLWSTGATTAAINVSPTTNTTYTVTVTNANGCTDSKSQAIVVNAIPTAAIAIAETSGTTNNDGAICNGASVTLTASGGSSYLWSTGATTAAINVSPTTNTTYTVTVTSNGCTDSKSQVIVVNAIPTAAIAIAETSGTTNNDGTICNGASVTLTASGGSSYLWSTGATTAAINVSPTTNTTYTVTVTNANGCTDSKSQAIVVNAIPTAAIAIAETSGTTNNDGTICNGASVTLTASGGTSYLWSTGATTAAINVSPSTNTTYTVTVTSNGCTNSKSQSIVVNAIPTAAIAIAETSGTTNNDGTICNGASVTLTASGGTSYLWSTGATTAAINVSPTTNTTYTVTVTNANGCNDSKSQAIVVVAIPTAAIAIAETSGTTNNDGTICNGASVTLTASGGTSYLWSTGATTAAINVSPTTNTTYTVTVTNANGCTDSKSQAIVVVAIPTAAIAIAETSGTTNNDGTICNGASVTLTASGGTSYLWSTGATTAAINVSPTTNTTYTVTVTNANGCNDSKSQAIVVVAIPTAAIAIAETSGTTNNDGAICNGAFVTLTASGGSSYLWSTGATTAAINVSPTTNTTYTVTVTSNGCTDSKSQVIVVNAIPTAAIAIAETSGTTNNDGTICNGASVTLTASGGSSYLWSTGATTAAINVSPTTNTTYTVTVTNANGCTDSKSQAIVVNAIPTAAIAIAETSGTTNNDGTICSGASVTLTASGGTSYLWSTGATAAAINVTPTTNTTYTVTVTSNGCTNSKSQSIVVNAIPTAAIAIAETSGTTNNDGTICNGASVALTASGGSSYLWSTGETTAAINVTPTTNTTYTVTVTNANGCTDSKSQAIVVVAIPTAAIAIAETSGTTNNDGTICNGASVTLTASGGISYLWSTGATTAAINVSPTTNTTYTVTVTNANGCTDSKSQAIVVVAIPTAAIAIAETSGTTNNDGTICNGASVTLTASGGTSYLWSTGATTAAINVSPTTNTTYTVTVTNANGCTDSKSQAIVVVAIPTAAIAIAETSGTTNNDGTICNGASVTLTASGGTSYLWSTGATTAAINVSPTTNTTYTVTVTNANGCTDSKNQAIVVVAIPTAAIAIAETSGTTNNDGTICNGASVTLTASGGTSYLWSTGATTAAINVSPTTNTTYTVTVTNANGCNDSKSQAIVVVAIPTAAIAIAETSGTTNNDGTICNGASVTLTASGGSSYLWSTGATTAAINVSPTINTTYTVTVTNANGCTDSKSQAIVVNAIPTAAIAIAETSGTTNNDGAICNGASVTLTASGGSSYLWSTGATTAAINVSPTTNTTYTVTVTNANGCTDSKSQAIVVVAIPIAAIAIAETSGTTNNDGTICNGASVTLTASGGTSYLWSTGATTAAINVSPTTNTTYTVTVTNANGCTDSKSQAIVVVAIPTAAIAIAETSGTTNNDGTICNGASVTLTASGGTSYLWSTGATTAAINVSPTTNTTYTVTVTNANGCTDSKSQAIVVVAIPTAAIAIAETSGTTNNDGTICNGASVTLTASGGTSYLWSTGATTAAINVSPTTNTTYTVTVTNANGCNDSKSQAIVVVAIPTAAIAIAETSGTTNNDGTICNGASVTLTASGGSSYLWSTGATTAAINVSPTSNTTYTVTVTNANGCTDSKSQAIVVVAIPTAAIAIAETSGTTNNDGTICNGASVTLTASGGSSYLWSTGATTAAINVSPTINTTYTVTVTNANGCTDSKSQAIVVNAIPTAAIAIAETSGTTNNDGAICNGASVTLTASGGSSYLWSTGETTAAINVTPTANTSYTVTVTSNGCTDSKSQAIVVNAIPTAAIAIAETSGTTNNDGTICNGASVTLTASGGSSYLWSTGETTAAINVTPTTNTTYTVTVTNANGCTDSKSQAIVVVAIPTAAIAIAETSGTTNNDGTICNGASVTLTASGGTSYLWSTGATTAAINVSPTTNTTYTVTVTNANGCNDSKSQAIVVVAIPTAAIAIAETSGTTNNDGTICNGASVTLTASGGSSYLWSTGATTAAINVSPTSNTTYTVTVTNANGCTDSKSQAIVVVAIPTAAIAIAETSGTTNNDGTICNGASVTLTASGGSSYLWSTGATTAAINVSPTTNTTYTVTVTNANGCTDSKSQAIVVNAIPTAAIAIAETSGTTNNDGAICNGASVTLTASGGISYLWSTGETTAAINVTPTANTSYTVTVTSNGCTDSKSQAIVVNAIPTAAIAIAETSGTTNNDGTICNGASVTLTASGGSSYLWSTGETTAAINVTPTTNTTYTVTVTNANGCTDSKSQAIVVVAIPTAAIAIAETSGTTNNDGTICNGASVTLTASGGSSYLWSSGATTAAINVSPTTNTTYTVTVTNANGCTDSKSQAIVVVAIPIAAIAIAETSGTTNNDGTICNGASVTLTASGGTSYLWSTGATTAAINVSPTTNTTYTVTVTNANGCTDSKSQAIVVVAIPTAAIAIAETSGTTNNDGTICNGASVTLTASGGSSYLWSTGATTAAINVSPTTNTTYTVTVTNANGCTDSKSQAIVVVAIPTAAIAIAETSGTTNNDGTICNGASVTLTASGGTSYLWSTGATTAAINVSPTTNTTYTVTVTNANGCTDSKSQAIVVVAIPTAAIAIAETSGTTNNDGTICNGASVALTASGGSSYLWSTGETTAAINVSPTTNTTYTVTVTNANGCTDSKSQAIVVVAIPTAAIAIAETSGTTNNDGTICNGASVTLTASGGSSYLWSTGATTAAINASPTTNTTYTVTVTNANGCTDSKSQAIVVVAIPTAAIAIAETSGTTNNDGTICNGASVTLTASGGSSYLWSTGATTAAINVSPNANTTYTVTVTNANGCDNSTLSTITVLDNPTPTISGPTPICQGSIGNVYSTDSGMTNYLWSVPTGGTITSGGSNTDESVTVRWDNNGLQTISVNYSNSNNCSASTPVTFDVTVDITPIANAGPDDTICYDNNYTIPSANVQNETSYQWKTLGDGKFENNLSTISNIIAPTYTPGDIDKITGFVKLVLNVTGTASCGNRTDTLVLKIPNKLQAAIGAPKPFDIDANTEIKVSIKTANHKNIQDLSYYLVAPDGITKVLLKSASNPLVNCNRNSDVNVTFNSKHTPVTDTLKVCGTATPLTGTFAATGDWSVLYNKFNPAEGGWAVEIKDNQTLTPLTTWTQGAIVHALISFGKTDTIIFDSGAINISINNGTTLLPKATSFIVPLGLRTKCANSCDATAIVNVIGGTAPYTYLWNSGVTKDTTDLCKGTYNVTVTDALGCSATASVNVTSPDPIVINSVSFSNNDTLKCYGTTTDITINATGGSGSIKYTYIGAPAANDTLPIGTAFTGIDAGVYQFHIFDHNNCSKDTTITIVAPDTIKIFKDTITNVVCYGSATGSISVKATGGTPKYVFTLKQAGIDLDTVYTITDSAQFTGLLAGSYTIALRDTNHCTSIAELPFTILQPLLPFTVDTVIIGNIKPCALDTNGWAKLIVTGGISPLSYILRNATDTFVSPIDSISGILSGSYTALVADNNNCQAIYAKTITIVSPQPITITSVLFANNDSLTCHDATTSITLNATGGSGLLQYTYPGALAPNDTLPVGNTFAGISGGTYPIHIFDNNGCTKDTSIIIFAPDTLKLALGEISPVLCFGSSTGKVVAKATGGTKKYVFTLKQAGIGLDTIYTMADSAQFTGLQAGAYTIALRDTNNCSVLSELPFIITQPASPFVMDTVFIGKLTPCALDTNGWAKFIVSGGSTPFTYILQNASDSIGSVTDSISKIATGSYTARVIDKNGCVANYAYPIDIVSDPAIKFVKFDINPVTNCYYNPNGSISVTLNRTNNDPSNIVVAIDTITGTYHPIDIASGNDYLFNNLTRGWHKFYAKDASATGTCIFTDSAFITSPAPIVITTVVEFISKTQRKITVTATGGTGTLNYALIDSKRDTVLTYGFSTNNVFLMDTLGIFSVLVRDSENCTAEKPVTLGDFTVVTTNIKCKGTKTGTIEIIPGTTGNYVYDLNKGALQNTTGKFIDLAAGNYIINVLNLANDTLYSDLAIITQPDSTLWIQPLSFSSADNICSYTQAVTATMMVRPYGGTGNYTYSKDSITFNIDPNLVFFGKGTHKVYVQDSIGCIVASIPITVDAPEPVVISVVSVVPVKGASKGSISLKASGPQKPMQFSMDGISWYGTDSTWTFTNLNASTYTFYARNSISCYDTLIYTIPSATNLPVIIIIDTSKMVCPDDQNASLTLMIDKSSTGPFRIFVTTLDTAYYTNNTQSFSGLGAGTYSIYVEDNAGSVFTKDTVIVGPPKVIISATVTPDNCSKYSTIGDVGAIRLSVPAVYSNYTFEWSNDSTSSQITNVNAGIYTVKVTFGLNNACSQTNSYIIAADDSVKINIAEIGTICPMTPVNLEATGAFTYTWIPATGLSDATISNPVATVGDTTLYSVIGIDKNNLCFDTARITINVFATMEIYNSPDTIWVANAGSAQLQANEGFTWYAWNPVTYLSNPAISNPIVTPESNIIYYVSGLTSNNCTVTDTIYVLVADKLVIPSGFTPNGDGINDVWEIGHAPEYADIVVEVFSRAGQKVFSSKGYDNTDKVFKGIRNGRDLPIGTYYYIIFPTKGSDGIRGSVTIVR